MIVAGYTRVSTDEQATSGLGLEAQTATITDTIRARGGTIAGWYTDHGVSGSTMDRPGLAGALAALAAHTADTLAVAKLDRLGRSTVGVLTLVERLEADGYGLIVCDLGLDTTTPVGQFTLSIMAAFGQLERRMISDRTRAALAAAKARGVRVGRPRIVDELVVDFARNLRSAGDSYAGIAADLGASGHPTAHGGPWTASTVRWLLTERSP